jgi:hypothetical protein
LPALLAGLFALLLVARLAWPMPVELPDVGVIRPLRLPPLMVVPLRADPEITQRPLFAPGRRETGNPGVADKAAALEGARAIGVIRLKGTPRVFVQAPDGTVTSVGLGGLYKGWRIVQIDRGQIIAIRGAETATLAVTASAPPRPPTASDEAQEEEEPQ